MEDGWKRIRTEIMMSHIENLVFPGVHGVCSICNTTINSTGTIRCQDCGPMAVFCDTCYKLCHKQGQLHFSEKWVVSWN